MRRIAFTLVLSCASLFAGVPGTYVETYTLTNNTGQTANDLHVDVGDFLGFGPGGPSQIAVTTQSPFPAADNTLTITGSPNGQVDFSGANVNASDAATFTITQPSTFSEFIPVVLDYQWSSNGSLIGSEQFPIGIAFSSAGFFNPLSEGFIGDNDTADHNYTNLSINQNGSSLLNVTGSGTLLGGGSAMPVTGIFNIAAGPVDFGITDTTAGFQLNGTFTPAAVPEPATWGASGLILLAMGVIVWRRRILAR